jgi:hypothetical protein
MCKDQAWIEVQAGKLIIAAPRGRIILDARAPTMEILQTLRRLNVGFAICSSSVDFPTEYGAPAQLTERVHQAFNIMMGN